MDQMLKRIKKLSELEPKTLQEMSLKISEEAGEVSQAVLSYTNASGSMYKQLESSDVKEECIDLVLVSLALFYKLSGDDVELDQFINKKLEKWEDHMNS
ncbi:MazG-like family protein [Halalkalibacillus halophilus]|uniref:MazG-like family protein n=1 Tax=Halalkalibacillus halophilus TaxID=392827 RepID=UPI0003FB6ABA|nr:MazG-like family protein [Halalkalibacillus halophilus]